MSQLWAAVSNIQKGLDDAAGIHTVKQDIDCSPKPTAGSSPAPAGVEEDRADAEGDGMRSLSELMEENLALKQQLARMMDPSPEWKEKEAKLLHEGKELAHEVGVLHAKNKELTNEIEDLLAELEKKNTEHDNLLQQEKKWKDSVKSSLQTEAALHEQTHSFQQKLQEVLSEKDQLETKCAEVQRQLEAAEGVIQSMKEQGQQSDADLREAWRNEVSSLEAELSRLRDSRRKDSIDADEKVAWLQRELTGAHQRAHAAELRANEMSRSVADSAVEVRQQLSAAEARCSQLSTLLQEADVNLVEARNEAKAKDGTIVDADRARSTLAADLKATKAQLQAAEMALQQQGDRVRSLGETLQDKERALQRETVTNRRLKSELEACLQEAEVEAAQAKLSQTKDTISTSASGPSSNGSAMASQSSVTVDRHAHTLGGPHAPATKLDRELVRLQLEVAELKKQLQSAQALEPQLHSLTKQHDVLLQMYGAQEETVDELKEMLQTTRESSRLQIGALGEQIALLQEKQAQSNGNGDRSGTH